MVSLFQIYCLSECFWIFLMFGCFLVEQQHQFNQHKGLFGFTGLHGIVFFAVLEYLSSSRLCCSKNASVAVKTFIRPDEFGDQHIKYHSISQ